MAFNRSEYRKQMADMFVESLKKINNTHWIKPWNAKGIYKGGVITGPFNGATNRYYNGANKFFLMYKAMERGYEDPRWMTYTQIHNAGYKMINAKGAGIPVEYWYPFQFDDDTYKTGRAISWKEYEELTLDDKSLCQLKFKTSYVFNGDLIEGLPELEIDETIEQPGLSEIVETISTQMNVPILQDGGNNAYYSPSSDNIHLPTRDSFDDQASFDAVALHELSHATGHTSRLNRLPKTTFGSDAYAYEELIAEISSTFMSPYISEEIDNSFHIQNHIAYVNGWIQAIQNDPEVLFKAIAEAEIAANYLEWKAGLINEQEMSRSLKNAHRAIGENDRAQLIENINQDESININEVNILDYLDKVIQNTASISEYFNVNEFNKSSVSIRSSNKEFIIDTFKTGDNNNPKIGYLIYEANNPQEYLFDNAGVNSQIPPYLSLIDIRKYISDNLSENIVVTYSVTGLKDDDAIKVHLLKQINQDIQKEELLAKEGYYTDANGEIAELKDSEVLLQNHQDELPNIDKFVEDHELVLKERLPEGAIAPIIINIFAGPDAGKDVAAIKLSNELSARGFNVKIVDSYASELQLDNKAELLDGSQENQYTILQEQTKRIDRYIGKADFIITDSPLIMNGLYGAVSKEYVDQVTKLASQYNNFNFFFDRKLQGTSMQANIASDMKIKDFFKEKDMFLGSYDIDNIEKAANNALVTYRRTQKAIEKNEDPSFKSFKKRSEQELEILKDSIDIKEYARDVLGFNVIKQGKNYSITEHDSVVIYPQNNFTRFSNRVGGSIIDFIKEFHPDAEKDTTKAISLAKQFYNQRNPERMHVFSNTAVKTREETMFESKEQYRNYLRSDACEYSRLNPELPERANNTRVIDEYLNKKRSISLEVINHWKSKDIIYQDTRNNLVFVGRDFDNNVKYYSQKGTGEKRFIRDADQEISAKSNGVVLEAEDAKYLYVGEAVIDMMSVQDLLGGPDNTKSSSFISTQSAGNIDPLLRYVATRDTSKIEAIYLCQDNDDAGNEAAKKCQEVVNMLLQEGKFNNKVEVKRLLPSTGCKDFNDELTMKRGQSKTPSVSPVQSQQINMSQTINTGPTYVP